MVSPAECPRIIRYRLEMSRRKPGAANNRREERRTPANRKHLPGLSEGSPHPSRVVT
jgi:hypothetical protein